MGKKLFVGNLPFKTTGDDLQGLFATAGTCESASVIMDRETGKSRGFGFVEMASDAEAEAAAVRDDGDVSVARPVKDGHDVGFVVREHDGVGRGRKVATQAADDVTKRFAVGVTGAVVGRGGEEGRQSRGGCHARGRAVDVIHPRQWQRARNRDIEPGRQQLPDRGDVLRRRATVFPAPTPESPSARGGHAIFKNIAGVAGQCTGTVATPNHSREGKQ